MTCAALIRYADTLKGFPIKIDQIIDWIKANNIQNEVDLFAVDIDTDVLWGVHHRFTTSDGMYGNARFHMHVLYGKALDQRRQRLVICKELLHAFDPPNHNVDTPAEVRKLVDALIKNKLGLSLAADDDHVGPFKALLVLIPPTARRLLTASIEAGQYTVAEAAQFVGLPDVYVEFWLSAAADEIVRILLGEMHLLDLLPPEG